MAVYTTIDDPSAYFKVQLYTGNGSARTITFDDTDTDMQPDLVWVKDRDATNYHFIYDSVRGDNLAIFSNDASAEVNVTSVQSGGGIGSQASDGFTIVAGTSNTNNVNTSSNKYVAWCWKRSTVSGVDIITYTGTGSATTRSHNLSAVPNLIFTKNRTDASTGNWYVYHHKNTSAPETDFMVFNDTDATSDSANAWNDTAPTSSVIHVGTNERSGGASGDAMVAYIWAEKQGFSKFGSYTGNGNADSTFVYLGFRPAWVMIKRTTGSTYNWMIFDNKRNTFNVIDDRLRANTNDAEQTGSSTHILDFVSNGFKIRSSNSAIGGGADPYIYMAFAEAPFVNSNGVPCNAR